MRIALRCLSLRKFNDWPLVSFPHRFSFAKNDRMSWSNSPEGQARMAEIKSQVQGSNTCLTCEALMEGGP